MHHTIEKRRRKDGRESRDWRGGGEGRTRDGAVAAVAREGWSMEAWMDGSLVRSFARPPDETPLPAALSMSDNGLPATVPASPRSAWVASVLA